MQFPICAGSSEKYNKTIVLILNFAIWKKYMNFLALLVSILSTYKRSHSPHSFIGKAIISWKILYEDINDESVEIPQRTHFLEIDYSVKFHNAHEEQVSLLSGHGLQKLNGKSDIKEICIL